jgi:hypothetical protein
VASVGWSLGALALGQQQGASAIIGRVVDMATGEAVGGAAIVITAYGTPRPVSRVIATDKGEFVVTGLARGRYTLEAAHVGYRAGRYGQEFPDELEAPVSVDGVNTVTSIVVPLWKPAIITGRVVDEGGTPVVGLSVMAVERVFASGRATFQPVEGAKTDDQGVYRILNLTPGDYVVTLAATTTQPAVFFPGLPSATGAEVFTLSAGAERTGIDFRIVKQSAPHGSIHGRVVPSGAGTPVTLFADDADEFVNIPLMHAQTGATGAYAFAAVPAGNYFVRAVVKATAKTSRASYYGRNSVAEAHVAVDRTNVTAPPLDLEAAGLSGRVVFRGDSDRPPMSTLLLFAARADGRAIEPWPSMPTRDPVDSDGRFSVTGLAAAKYFVSVEATGAAAWHTQEVTVQGRPVPNDVVEVGPAGATDIVVVMTDTPRATLAGMIVDDDAHPRGAASVYLIPSDATLWLDCGYAFRFQTQRSDASGHFSFQAPAGDYLVAATTSGIAGFYWVGEPIFEALKTIAVKLHLDDGAAVTKDLIVRKAPPWR